MMMGVGLRKRRQKRSNTLCWKTQGSEKEKNEKGK